MMKLTCVQILPYCSRVSLHDHAEMHLMEYYIVPGVRIDRFEAMAKRKTKSLLNL